MTECAASLTVMSYNIQHGRGMDDRYDPARIADVIRRAGADVIGLQEVDRHFDKRSNYEDTIMVLAARLGMQYAYGANLDGDPEPGRTERRQYGIGILSKYPIVHQQHYLLDSAGREQRGLLEAELVVEDARVRFYVTHLGLERQERLTQISQIVDIAARQTGAAIITGDFNALPDSPELAAMSRSYRNVFADLPAAYTYPAGGAKETIDYILVNDGIAVGARREVVRSVASDHYPIAAALSIR
ncbi:MAG: endonuclease/exonuclease/phosphatase family protein [Paenibacillus dendritiformis]|uniref:endonuclease/exonuclease/phosphatase family protein n=1 Tax=Paenibacillus dendritiformis TaxID=130049 RepID=UPI001B19C838|nr:endonuclease/exonuclease/phosphatase family protein [Paenibacillus dendritiformis]MDU5142882.1 endonuclease/exonuclease/phosphatase family protein [Paenibacillus dendritiformis]GIO73607.1 metal-dependent hydrolase [Paenibacillus dendritiformis]